MLPRIVSGSTKSENGNKIQKKQKMGMREIMAEDI